MLSGRARFEPGLGAAHGMKCLKLLNCPAFNTSTAPAPRDFESLVSSVRATSRPTGSSPVTPIRRDPRMGPHRHEPSPIANDHTGRCGVVRTDLGCRSDARSLAE